ncbi:MAG: penicillin-binding transpeptidase domain-containing protein [Actinomycetaceae bacterium]|nr:penicillin-binding transpeptidase domain-containing protein [Actinomycetaceae bacterium]
MNAQIRKIYIVVFLMVISLAMAATYIQFFAAPTLNADERNARTILHAAERDRGPIIVSGTAIAQSISIPDSLRYERTYPGKETYASVTGWFSSSLRSSTGLEAAAENVLEGDAPSLWAQRIQNLLTGKERQGGGIVLTINPAVQQAAEQAIGGRKGAAVALNPHTGAVLALYSSPSYDPNTLAQSDSTAALETYQNLEQDPSRPLINRAVAGDRYPPGSVFKLITAAAMLESGEYTPDTQVEGPASITLPGTETQLPNITRLPCGNGEPPLKEAFARSCNTSFALAAIDIGEEHMRERAEAFGFGQSLDIPLPVTPSVFPDSLNDARMGLVGVGQDDVAVTPMQMAMVGAAIANDGVLMKPYLIESVVNADLEPQQTTSAQQLGVPIQEKTAAQLREMMTDVVSQPYGTGRSVAMSTPVAAKTGTAETGTQGRTVAWMVAFPATDDPQVAVAVAIEGDDLNPYVSGGADAGPVARAMIEAVLSNG